MTKTLTLKPRALDVRDEPQWHDRFVLENALLYILKGKNALESPMWLRIAGKVQAAGEAVEFGRKDGEREIGRQRDGQPIMADVPHMPEFQVRLGNQDAHQLWVHLEKLPYEQFGNGQMPPGPPGCLYWMLADFAVQLGEKYAAAEDEEDTEGTKEA